MAHGDGNGIDDGFIYKITAPDGRVYIGQTVDFKRRIGEHKRRTQSRQPRLKTSIEIYGFDTHKVDILWKGRCSRAELCDYENYYISQYDSQNPQCGLNSTKYYLRYVKN